MFLLLLGFGRALLRVDTLAGIPGDITMLETSRQRLVERGEIVHCSLPVLAANGKTTVFGFLGDGVLEHHHGSHLEGATHGVRNVVAFDA